MFVIPSEACADPSDTASLLEQQARDANILAARAAVAKPLLAIGQCHNCDEPLESGVRFCDDSCRDDHQHRANRRRING